MSDEYQGVVNPSYSPTSDTYYKLAEETGDQSFLQQAQRQEELETELGLVDGLMTTDVGRRRGLLDLLPFGEEARDLDYMYELGDAFEAQIAGRASTQQLDLIQKYHDFSLRDRSKWFEVGSIAGGLPAFGLEVGAASLVSMGVGGLAAAGRKAASKAASRYAIGRFAAQTLKPLEKAAQAIGKFKTNNIAAGGFRKIAGYTQHAATTYAKNQYVGGVVGGETFGHMLGGGSRLRGMAYANVLRNKYGVEQTPYGAVARLADDSYGMWTDALPTAALDLYIEYFSEGTGMALVHLPAATKIALTGTPFKASGTSARMLRFLGLMDDTDEAAKQLSVWSVLGQQGLASEIGEEFIGGGARDLVHQIAPELMEGGNVQYLVDNIGTVTMGMMLGMGPMQAVTYVPSKIDATLAYKYFPESTREAFATSASLLPEAEKSRIGRALHGSYRFLKEGLTSLGSANVAATEGLTLSYLQTAENRARAKAELERLALARDPDGGYTAEEDEITEWLNNEFNQTLEEVELLTPDGRSPFLQLMQERGVLTPENAGMLIEDMERRIGELQAAQEDGTLGQFLTTFGMDQLAAELSTKDRAGADAEGRVAIDTAAVRLVQEQVDELRTMLGVGAEGEGDMDAARQRVARQALDPQISDVPTAEVFYNDLVDEIREASRLDPEAASVLQQELDETAKRQGTKPIQFAPGIEVPGGMDLTAATGLTAASIETEEDIDAMWLPQAGVVLVNSRRIQAEAERTGLPAEDIAREAVLHEIMHATEERMGDKGGEYIEAVLGHLRGVKLSDRAQRRLDQLQQREMSDELRNSEEAAIRIADLAKAVRARRDMAQPEFQEPEGLLGVLKLAASNIVGAVLPRSRGIKKYAEQVKQQLQEAGVAVEGMQMEEVLLYDANLRHVLDLMSLDYAVPEVLSDINRMGSSLRLPDEEEERLKRPIQPQFQDVGQQVGSEFWRRQPGERAFAEERKTSEETTNIYWSRGDNKILSNLAPSDFEVDGRKYVSVEHYYQTNKSGEFDQATYDQYINYREEGKRPGEGLRIRGQKPVNKEVNDQVMLRGLRERFAQDAEARAALQKTGTSKLTHRGSVKDYFTEAFPRLLTQVRDEIFPTAAQRPAQEQATRGVRPEGFIGPPSPRQLIAEYEAFGPDLQLPNLGEDISGYEFGEADSVIVIGNNPETMARYENEWKKNNRDSKGRFLRKLPMASGEISQEGMRRWLSSNGVSKPRVYGTPEQVAALQRVLDTLGDKPSDPANYLEVGVPIQMGDGAIWEFSAATEFDLYIHTEQAGQDERVGAEGLYPNSRSYVVRDRDAIVSMRALDKMSHKELWEEYKRNRAEVKKLTGRAFPSMYSVPSDEMLAVMKQAQLRSMRTGGGEYAEIDNMTVSLPPRVLVPFSNAEQGEVVLIQDDDDPSQIMRGKIREFDEKTGYAKVVVPQQDGTLYEFDTRPSNLFHPQLSLRLSVPGQELPLWSVDGELLRGGAVEWNRGVVMQNFGEPAVAAPEGAGTRRVEAREGESAEAFRERVLEEAYNLYREMPNWEEILKGMRNMEREQTEGARPGAKDRKRKQQTDDDVWAADTLQAQRRMGMWDALSEMTGLRPDVVRQVIQINRKGIGINPKLNREYINVKQMMQTLGAGKDWFDQLSPFEREKLEKSTHRSIEVLLTPIEKEIQQLYFGRLDLLSLRTQLMKLDAEHAASGADHMSPRHWMMHMLAASVQQAQERALDVALGQVLPRTGQQAAVDLQGGAQQAEPEVQDDSRRQEMIGYAKREFRKLVQQEQDRGTNITEPMRRALMQQAAAITRREFGEAMPAQEQDEVREQRGGVAEGETVVGEMDAPVEQETPVTAPAGVKEDFALSDVVRVTGVQEVMGRLLTNVWGMTKMEKVEGAQKANLNFPAIKRGVWWRRFLSEATDASIDNALVNVASIGSVLDPRGETASDLIETDRDLDGQREMRHSLLVRMASQLSQMGVGPTKRGGNQLVGLHALSPSSASELLEQIGLPTPDDLAAVPNAQAAELLVQKADNMQIQLAKLLASDNIAQFALDVKAAAERGENLEEVEAQYATAIAEARRGARSYESLVGIANRLAALKAADMKGSLAQLRKALDTYQQKLAKGAKRKGKDGKMHEYDDYEKQVEARVELLNNIASLPMFQSGAYAPAMKLARALTTTRLALAGVNLDLTHVATALRNEARDDELKSHASAPKRQGRLMQVQSQLHEQRKELETMLLALEQGNTAAVATRLRQMHDEAPVLKYSTSPKQVVGLGYTSSLKFTKTKMMDAIQAGKDIFRMPRKHAEFFMVLNPTVVYSPQVEDFVYNKQAIKDSLSEPAVRVFQDDENTTYMRPLDFNHLAGSDTLGGIIRYQFMATAQQQMIDALPKHATEMHKMDAFTAQGAKRFIEYLHKQGDHVLARQWAVIWKLRQATKGLTAQGVEAIREERQQQREERQQQQQEVKLTRQQEMMMSVFDAVLERSSVAPTAEEAEPQPDASIAREVFDPSDSQDDDVGMELTPEQQAMMGVFDSIIGDVDSGAEEKVPFAEREQAQAEVDASFYTAVQQRMQNAKVYMVDLTETGQGVILNVEQRMPDGVYKVGFKVGTTHRKGVEYQTYSPFFHKDNVVVDATEVHKQLLYETVESLNKVHGPAGPEQQSRPALIQEGEKLTGLFTFLNRGVKTDRFEAKFSRSLDDDYLDPKPDAKREAEKALGVKVPDIWEPFKLPDFHEPQWKAELFLASYDNWLADVRWEATQASAQHALNKQAIVDFVEQELGMKGLSSKAMIRDIDQAMLFRMDLDYWVHEEAGFRRGRQKLRYERGNDDSLWDAVTAAAKGKSKLSKRHRHLFELAKKIRGDARYATIKQLVREIKRQQEPVSQRALKGELIKGTIYSYVSLGYMDKDNRVFEEGETSNVGLLEVSSAGGPFREDVGYRRKSKQFVSVLQGLSEGLRLSNPSMIDSQQRTRKVVSEALYNKAWLIGMEKSGIIKPLADGKMPQGFKRLTNSTFKDYVAPAWVAKHINNATTQYGIRDIENKYMRWYMRATIAAKHMMLLFGFFHHQAFLRSYLFTVEGSEAKKAVVENNGLMSISGAALGSYGAAFGLMKNKSLREKADRFSGMQFGREAWVRAKPEFELLVRQGLTVQLSNEMTQTMGGAYYTSEDVADMDNLWDSVTQRIKAITGDQAWVDKAVGAVNSVRMAQRETAEWLFNHMGANLKIAAGILKLRELERKNMDKVKADPNYRNELARIAAEHVNADFGGLDLRGRSGKLSDYMGMQGPRNPRNQMILRGLLLAPDWTESNAAAFVGAFKKQNRVGAPKGIEEIQKKTYQLMWGRVFMRAAATQMLITALLAGIDDERDFADMYADAGFPGSEREDAPKWWKLYWTGVDIGKRNDEKQKVFASVFGHFLDPFKWITEIFGKGWGSPIEKKGSVAARALYEFGVGKNWRGQRYTSWEELVGTDDKGVYKRRTLLSDGTVKNAGDPKGGQLTGQLAAWSDRTGFLRPGETPSWVLDQFTKPLPIQMKTMFDVAQGAKAGQDWLLEALGFKLHTHYYKD